ncbi:MAG TPA: hypothetical protein VK528_14235 [Flavobacterium sp.]|nr:hypothetical protein [Flavobacterium sp.]
MQKIFLFTTLAFAFLYIANGKSESANTIQKENPVNDFSQEGFHSLAFLQPESARPVVSNFKTIDHSVLKIPGLFNFDFRGSEKQKTQKSFLSQDINRCEKVSLLLFPFHIFW